MMTLKKVALTGLGAATVARETAAGAMKKFLAKGEAMEPTLRKGFKAMVAGRKKASQTAGRWSTRAQGGFRKVMEAIPVVTKSDVAGLMKRIDALTTKVEALSTKKRR